MKPGILLLAGILALVPADRLSVSARPQTFFAGAEVDITCHVPRDADNRWLEIGIQNYSSSGVQLDGDNAAITYPAVRFRDVPCGVTAAYCTVLRRDGHTSTAVTPLTAPCSDDAGQ